MAAHGRSTLRPYVGAEANAARREARSWDRISRAQAFGWLRS